MWLIRVFLTTAMWISCSQSQAPVLTPASTSVGLGQSITFNCNVGVKDGGVTAFIKQTPGDVPLGIMSHHHSWTDPKYAPGVSSAHFTATINPAGTEYQFIIRNIELMDAAKYYCIKWYVSLSGYVFSEKSSLIVTGANYPEADMTLFPPQPEAPSGNTQPTLTCLISKLSVPFGTVSWMVDGKVAQNAITSEPKRDTSGSTFSMSSYLTVPEVNRDSTFTCQIQQAGSASKASRSLKISECA